MEVLRYGDPEASVVLIQPVDEHDIASMENEIEIIRRNTTVEFMMLAFRIGNWNQDLSPWNAPAVFGNEGFGDGASGILAEILDCCGDQSKTYYIGGYSLAGLFALWTAYQTDAFRGIAAASPSMWFPGFAEYMAGHELKCGNVYLSLGDKEERTRNPVMATVGSRIRDAYDRLKRSDVNCVLEWNEGNHFRDADMRTAKAFTWVIEQFPKS